MATYVTKLELITGNGKILTLHSNDTSDPLLFRSAVNSWLIQLWTWATRMNPNT